MGRELSVTLMNNTTRYIVRTLGRTGQPAVDRGGGARTGPGLVCVGGEDEEGRMGGGRGRGRLGGWGGSSPAEIALWSWCQSE